MRLKLPAPFIYSHGYTPAATVTRRLTVQ